MRDYKRLTQDPPGGISGAPCADNIMVWNAVIFGPGKELEANSADGLLTGPVRDCCGGIVC